MDIKVLIEAFVQFLTDFFAALGKFLGVDFTEDELVEESTTILSEG